MRGLSEDHRWHGGRGHDAVREVGRGVEGCQRRLGEGFFFFFAFYWRYIDALGVILDYVSDRTKKKKKKKKRFPRRIS